MTESWQDDLFARTARRRGDFVFDESVAVVFDDMVERSVPFYVEQQAMFAELARRLWQPGTLVLDLGCSTGTTLVSICSALPEARAVGVDNSQPLLERAGSALGQAGLSERVELVDADLEAGIGGLALEPASFVTVCWTLQFLGLDCREALLREVYDLLIPGGALVLAEKIVHETQGVADLYTELYHEFKRRNGYSQTETARKRQALEGVLVPSTIEGNLDLLRRAGFEAPSPFFQWYPFAAFLGVKHPA